MRKITSIMLASTLLVAFAAPAMAALETSGSIRLRNFHLASTYEDGGTSNYTDMRLRLGMKWAFSETGFVAASADIEENLWGNDTSDIDFDSVYGQFMIEKATLTLGRQPVPWGLGMAFGNPAEDSLDRAKVSYPVGPVKLEIVYDALREGYRDALVDTMSDDAFGLGLSATATHAGWNMGVMYYRSSDDSAIRDRADHNFHGFVAGAAGPVTLKAEVHYAVGEDENAAVAAVLDDPSTPTVDESAPAAAESTTDRSGLAAYAGASVNVGTINLSLDLGYARGDDPDTDENEGVLTHDYHSPFWSVILFNSLDLDGIPLTISDREADTGLANVLAVKGSAMSKVTERLQVLGALMTGKFDEPGENTHDDLGLEFDLIFIYNIAPNIIYTVGGGYLDPGDALWMANDCWGIMNGVEIYF